MRPFLPVSYTHLDVYKRQVGDCPAWCREALDIQSETGKRKDVYKRQEKTDRAALADLFTEFSLRLKNKFELPEE